MPSPKMWSGYFGKVMMEYRDYPKPCGSPIFNSPDPLAFPVPAIDNDYMTFKEWTITLSMTMLERNMPTSRGEGWYPTLPSGEISLSGLVPKGGNPGFYLGCPLFWYLELKDGPTILARKLPVIVSKMEYNNSVTGPYGISVSAKVDYSFDARSSDPTYNGWVDMLNNKINPKTPTLTNYPWTLKGKTP